MRQLTRLIAGIFLFGLVLGLIIPGVCSAEILSKEIISSLNIVRDQGVIRLSVMIMGRDMPKMELKDEIENLSNWHLSSPGDLDISLVRVEAGIDEDAGKIAIVYLYLSDVPKDGITEIEIQYSRESLGTVTMTEDQYSPWYARANFDEMAVQRLLKEESFLAFKYDLSTTLIGYNSIGMQRSDGMTAFFRNWDISLGAESEGVIGSDNELENATTTTAGLNLARYWGSSFGAIMRLNLEAGYSLETSADDDENSKASPITLRNEAWTFSLTSDIPWTNYLLSLPTGSGFARESPPMRVRYRYWAGENDAEEASTAERFELKGYWELPFSEYLILEGTVVYNNFPKSVPEPLAAAIGNGDLLSESFHYSVRVAQTTQAFMTTFSSLIPYLEASGHNVETNNFIYFEITDGRLPPDFEENTERKIGVSLTF